jgi:hypothetical protein
LKSPPTGELNERAASRSVGSENAKSNTLDRLFVARPGRVYIQSTLKTRRWGMGHDRHPLFSNPVCAAVTRAVIDLAHIQKSHHCRAACMPICLLDCERVPGTTHHAALDHYFYSNRATYPSMVKHAGTLSSSLSLTIAASVARMSP